MMEFLSPIASFALPATALLLLTLLVMRVRNRHSSSRNAARDALDTVMGWPPEASRILTINERQAYDLLKRAMPGFLVLAQVPLSRFIRVPARHSYAEWLSRVGSLSADLLLCDAGSKVLAVIDIRAQQESDRARRRHERMARVLRSAGVHVFDWREGELPSATEVRHVMARLVGAKVEAAGGKMPAMPTTSRPMPLIPVPEMEEILADGDRAAAEGAFDPMMEPVPSAFLEELETQQQQR